MKLSEYRRLHGLSISAMAKLLDEQHETVRLWDKGKRFPRGEALRKIAQMTGGAVTANDFVGDPEPLDKGAAA